MVEILILSACRFSPAYVSLLLVYAQHALYLIIKRLVYTLQRLCYVFMYGAFTYAEMSCDSSYG